MSDRTNYYGALLSATTANLTVCGYGVLVAVAIVVWHAWWFVAAALAVTAFNAVRVCVTDPQKKRDFAELEDDS